MKVWGVWLVIFCTITAIGQTVEEFPVTKPSSLTGLSISGHSYPLFLGGEEHSSFLVQYGFSESAQLELQGFYDTYLLTNRFRTSLLGKIYLDEKAYLLSGFDTEIEISKYGNKPVPPRLGFVNGVGYDVKDNLMLEVKSNLQLNNTKMGLFGESQIKMPSVFTIGSKLKF